VCTVSMKHSPQRVNTNISMSNASLLDLRLPFMDFGYETPRPKNVTVGTPIAREFAFEVLCHNEWNGDEKLLNMPSGKRGTDGVIR
jgi:hypothetical protein